MIYFKGKWDRVCGFVFNVKRDLEMRVNWHERLQGKWKAVELVGGPAARTRALSKAGPLTTPGLIKQYHSHRPVMCSRACLRGRL